jgi:hypothetical protein
VLKLTLAISGDSLSVEGDLDLPPVLPVIHDWYAARPQTVTDEWAARVTQSLDALLTLTQGGSSAAERGLLMATIADIHAQADRALLAIAAESDKDDAIIALVNANTVLITSLRDQLAAAIAANDPAALQAVLDQLTAVETSALANGQKVTDAVNLNTAPAV